MNEKLLYNGEYSILGQIKVSGPISYIMIFLFFLSIIILFLSWYIHLKIKTDKRLNLVYFSNTTILLLTIILVYVHSIVQENIIKYVASLASPDNISSDLVLRGFYISKIIPRFALIIGAIVIISMIPILLNTKKDK